MFFSLFDYSPLSITGICFVLLQHNAGVQDLGGWFDFANNLTVPGVLLFGLYYLYKMKERTEEKRDKYIKELLEKVDKANAERIDAYSNKITFLNEQLFKAEEERKELQNKLLDGNK